MTTRKEKVLTLCVLGFLFLMAVTCVVAALMVGSR